MKFNMKESDVLEFSTEVVKLTGSTTKAIVFAVLSDMVGEKEAPVSLIEVADAVGMTQNKSMNSLRLIFKQLHAKGLIRYKAGSGKFALPRIRILERFENDTDVDLKWKMTSESYYKSSRYWLLTHMEYHGDIVTVKELYNLCERTLTKAAISCTLTRLQEEGIVEKVFYTSSHSNNKAAWKLKDKYLEVA